MWGGEGTDYFRELEIFENLGYNSLPMLHESQMCVKNPPDVP